MRILVDGVLAVVGTLNSIFRSDGWGRGKPGPTNTGYRNAPGYPGSLTLHDGSPILSNTTYSFIQFEGLEVGQLSTPVHVVKFEGCLIKDDAVNAALVKLFADGLVEFSFCSFEPLGELVFGVMPPFETSYQYGISCSGAYGTFHDELIIDSCDFWGFGNAIDLGNPGSSQSKPVSIRHSWIHDAADDNNATYHTDGIGHLTGLGGESHFLIEHNTIESLGNTNGIAFQAGVYDHITIRHNYFGGFGFTIAIWNDEDLGVAQNIVFTDNQFSTQIRVLYGPLYPQYFWEVPGNVWKRNRWYVPEGAEWGSPANSGKYWIPNAASSGTETDAPWVSTTDYTGP